MNFEERLNKIQAKYNLKAISVDEQLISIFNEIPDRARIGIRGATRDAEKIISLISSNKNIICVFDIDEKLIGNKLLGYNIFSPKEMKIIELDYIIIANYHHKENMKKEASHNNDTFKIVDPYDEIKERCQIDCGYLSAHADLREGYLNYNAIFMYRDLYYKSKNREDQQKYLHNLISQYLGIRDFMYGKRYIEEYIDKKYENYHHYRKLNIELDELLNDLGHRLKHIKNQNLSLFLLDALRYEEVNPIQEPILMPYLNNLTKESIVFTNAFSPSVHTRASFYSMMTGKNLLDDSLFSKESVDVCESEWLTELINDGYKMLFFLNSNKKYILDSKKLKVVKKDFISASKMLWEYICELEEHKDEKVIALIHIVLEAHTPYICGLHTKKPILYDQDIKIIKFNKEKIEERKKQCAESLKYLDTQIKFYQDLLPREHIRVFFSDHGKNIDNFDGSQAQVNNKFGYHDKEIHVPFIINSSDIETFEYSGLFSMKDIGSIITGVLQNKLKIEENDYVEIQLEPIYNKSLIESGKVNEENYLANGYKVVRGEWDKYVLAGNGVEKYHLIPDEKTNLIDEEKFQKRINYLRSKLKTTDFPNYDSEKFKYYREFFKETKISEK